MAPNSFWTYFCRRGWPTSPRIADASEWPISGTVPRKSGTKFFAADSRMISMSGFSAPVCFRNARCCFSTIRTGLMNGAERIEAAVAAAKPGLPDLSPVTTP